MMEQRAQTTAPRMAFLTWCVPHPNFLGLLVGMIAVLHFGLTFWSAVLAVAAGTALGAVAYGVLASRGVVLALPQGALSRIAFGFRGSVVAGGLTSVAETVYTGVAFLMVSLAVAALTGLSLGVAMLIRLGMLVLRAKAAVLWAPVKEDWEIGTDFQKRAVAAAATAWRGVRVLVGAGVVVCWIVVLTRTNVEPGGDVRFGDLLGAVSVAFAAGAWRARDATAVSRYVRRDASPTVVGRYAAMGLFGFLLAPAVVGIAAATATPVVADNPVRQFATSLPAALSIFILLVIATGLRPPPVMGRDDEANAAADVPLAWTRGTGADVRQLVVTVAGMVAVAWWAARAPIARTADLMLLGGAVIGAWLGVALTDRLLHGRRPVPMRLFGEQHRTAAGLCAMLIGVGMSVWWVEAAPIIAFAGAATVYAVTSSRYGPYGRGP